MKSRIITAAACLLLAACGGEEAGETASEAGSDTLAAVSDSAAMPAAGGSATAMVRDSAGRDLGTLTLANSGDGIEVTGTLTGLAPGEHGIHLHTTGQCEPTFAAAGDHWNPAAQQHGRPGSGHRGDMENITAGADSSATVRVMTGAGASLRGEAGDALLDADGAAVVVHAAADDYTTQPSGGSGDRIGCGVVQG